MSRWINMSSGGSTGDEQEDIASRVMEMLKFMVYVLWLMWGEKTVSYIGISLVWGTFEIKSEVT